MIPNTHPYVAFYMDDVEMKWCYKPVVAWDDSGQPLVVDLVRRELRLARHLDHFSGIQYAPLVELPDGTITNTPEAMEEWTYDSDRAKSGSPEETK